MGRVRQNLHRAATRVRPALELLLDNQSGLGYRLFTTGGAHSESRRGVYTITDRGSEFLSKNPAKIGIADLQQFEEFRRFRSGSQNENEDDRGSSAGSGNSAPASCTI